MTTSNMSSGKSIYGGFGPPHIDGYGICYQIKESSINFSVSVDTNSTKTNIFKMTDAIEGVLKELISFFPSRLVLYLY